MIDDAFVAIEQFDEGLARLRIDEARRIERLNDVLSRVRRIAEDLLEMGIGGERRRRVGGEGAHIDTLAQGVKHARERDVALHLILARLRRADVSKAIDV